MIEKLFTRGILLVFFLAHVNTSPLSSETAIGVTVSIMDRYHATCVYLLSSQLQQEVSKHTALLKMKALVAVRPATVAVIFDISLIRNLRQEPSRPFFVIISDNGTTALQKYLQKESMANTMSAGRWLLFLERMMSLEDYFSDIHVPINCEFLVAQEQDAAKDGCSEVTLTEVFYVHRTRPLQTYRIGTWSSCDGVTWSTVPFDERRGDLRGAVIKSGIYSIDVAKDIETCKERTALKFCGQIEEIWHILQEILNFTSIYYVAEDKAYGSQRNDGTWNGVMNLTVSKQVEVGIGRFIFTEERMSAVHFLPPILITRMSVFIEEIDTDESTWHYVLGPLSYGMWWALGAAMAMLALFLFATSYLGRKYGNQPEVKNYSFYDSWIDVMASFCQQGQATTPRSWACRVVFVTSYFTAVVVLVAYSATFISFLTVRRTVLPFTDFKGLLNDGTYKLGVFPNSAQMYYFENSTDPTLKGVLERQIKPDYDNLPTNDTEGLRRICDNKNYAFLTSLFFVRQCYGDYNCNVVEVPDASFHASTSIIMNKESQYKRLFTQRLQQMRRNGILKAIGEKYLPLGVTNDDVKFPRSVSLQKTLPVFIVLMSGVFISIACLLIEVQVYKQCWRRHASFTTDYCE